MKVKLAKTAGFCMGVRRAMELVLAEANKTEGPIFTYGPLIHNRQVVELLESKGIEQVEDINIPQTGEIAIRAHGIPPQERQAITNKGLTILDATCPRVARVQAIIRYYTGKGYTAVIVGDEDHAEVTGLLGYSKGPAYVIQSVEDVSALPDMENIFVVAQTTQNERTFQNIIGALKRRFPHVMVFDTICEATNQRQQEVSGFKGQVQAVVVVGGYHSGNTRRLVEVAKESGLPTFHVETEKDIDEKKLSKIEVVGVTAGASTPSWMIKKVVSKLENIQSPNRLNPVHWIRKLFRFSVLSNAAVAIGAFCLSWAASLLAGREPDIIFSTLSSLYIYAMHVFNQFLDKGASIYNDPERAAFLKKHSCFLISTGISAIMIALILAYTTGWTAFFVLIGLSLLGVIYSIPFIPQRLRNRTRYSKIKDIPGSRSLSEALAWVAVISILPILAGNSDARPSILVSICVVFLVSYARALFLDIFQAQGDLVVGTETLPVIIGEKKTLLLLNIILCATGLILMASIVSGIIGMQGYIFILPLFTLFFSLLAYEKRWFYPGVISEALVESNLFLIGLLAFFWYLFPCHL